MSGEIATVVLVPHTHWDREWYEPFQVFRLRLVDVLDDVVARAEADPDFKFTIVGQMAAVDDYLEIRPENRAPADASLPAPAAGIAVSGTGVAVSAVRAREGGTEVRLVAMTDEPTTATVTGPFTSARHTDLLGRPLEALPLEDGHLTVDLGPSEIATLRLTCSVDAGTESS